MFSKTVTYELNEFLLLNKQGRIPPKLTRAGGGSRDFGSADSYKDAKTGTVYTVHTYRNNIPKLKVKELAEVYKTQPWVVYNGVPQIYEPHGFENASLAELDHILGEDLPSFLVCYSIENYAPNLTREFARYYLTQLSDFSSASLPKSQTLSSISTDFPIMAQFEGYWTSGGEGTRVDADVYNLSKQMIEANQQKPFGASDLQTLREFILNKIYSSFTTRPDLPVYPLPNPEKWPEQDKVVALLELLTRNATKWHNFLDDQGVILAQVKSDISGELFDKLLLAHIQTTRYPSAAYGRLAFPGDIRTGNREFSIQLSNGTELKWTQDLTNYIKFYNVMPSKEFLEKLPLLEPLLTANQEALQTLAPHESPSIGHKAS